MQYLFFNILQVNQIISVKYLIFYPWLFLLFLKENL